MGEVILKTVGLSGGYQGKEVIHSIDMEIREGEFVGIIGPNGSGKSTLLRMITRVLPIKNGSVFFRGRDLKQIPLKSFCAETAFVLQELVPAFSYTVGEYVLMGRIPHLTRFGLESAVDREIARGAMEMTDTLSLDSCGIVELSAGERQRVMIAQALAQEPKILFLDEPTSHLDIAHQIQIMNLLKKLNRETGLTVVIVLHDLNLASEYCTRLMLMERGRVVSDGDPEAVLTYENIERVYKTVVIVEKNRVSKRPFIVVVSGEGGCLSRSH